MTENTIKVLKSMQPKVSPRVTLYVKVTQCCHAPVFKMDTIGLNLRFPYLEDNSIRPVQMLLAYHAHKLPDMRVKLLVPDLKKIKDKIK